MKVACIVLYSIAAGILVYGFEYCILETELDAGVNFAPMWFFGFASAIFAIIAVAFTIKLIRTPKIDKATRDKVGIKMNCQCCNVVLRREQFRFIGGGVFCNSCYNKLKTNVTKK